jgi:plastin-1
MLTRYMNVHPKLCANLVAGIDILNGQRKLVLALLYQLMRCHTRQLLQSISGGRAISDTELDAHVLNWANSHVSNIASVEPLKSFSDPSISSGLFLLALLATLQPGLVNYRLVTAGESTADKELNAKYAISCARKLGCYVFLSVNDIIHVRHRMVLNFIAAIMVAAEAQPSQ